MDHTCRAHGERLAAVETTLKQVEKELTAIQLGQVAHAGSIRRAEKFWFAAFCVVIALSQLDRVKAFLGGL